VVVVVVVAGVDAGVADAGAAAPQTLSTIEPRPAAMLTVVGCPTTLGTKVEVVEVVPVTPAGKEARAEPLPLGTNQLQDECTSNRAAHVWCLASSLHAFPCKHCLY
jgi:hypothetical protein